MENSYSRDSKMNEKKRRRTTTLTTMSDQRPREWKAVTRGMTKQVTRLEFAAASTKIVTMVSSAVVRRLLKPLSKRFGIKAILEANDKLKEMTESKSSKCSVSDASAQRSPMEVSDFICHLGQRIVTEIKGAMLEAIWSSASGTRASCSMSAPSPAEGLVSQLDDLSIICTNEICDNILALYHSQKLHRRRGETTSVMSLKSLLDFQKLMKGLEKVVSVSRYSSWVTVSTTSDLVSTTTEVMSPGCASSAPQSMSPFSEQFKSVASEVVSEVLLKMEQKLASSMSSQTSVPASIETEPNFLRELAKSTAIGILQKLFCVLVNCGDADQTGPEHEQKFLSFAQEIHMDIHKRVFAFICERQQAISEKSKTFLDACTKTDAELDVSMENVQKSDAAGQFLDKATQVVSDVLVKRLTSQISIGLISTTGLGSSTAPSSMSLNLNQVLSGSVHKMISEVALEINDMEKGSEALVGEALVSDTDASSAPYTKSSSVFSSQLQSLSGLEESVLDAKREPLPSVQKSQYVPLHLFTVVRGQLKAFFTSFSKGADDDKGTDPSALSESEEDSVVPIYIDEEGSVHKLEVGQSLSDSVLVRRNSMLRSVQFPPQLIYKFVEESTQALLQNVLNTSVSDGSDGRSIHAAEDQEKKKRPRVRFVLKTSRHVVVKRPKKQKKRRRVPLRQGDRPSTSTSARLHEDSHKESKPSRSIFKNTRKTLGRIFSNISKTFTSIFNTSNRPRNSSE
ncbi:hypothetical protein QTP70_022555 [Hemibagrus guttatus]|uniref:Uncharacterized protein n=1 Tax=Hemibagrus guttatus TaxID=175788 RepID=A0AAE0Q991_9TELE|nr:hypothetical protein QTP70_022555 [Hemibagrus guttatus]